MPPQVPEQGQEDFASVTSLPFLPLGWFGTWAGPTELVQRSPGPLRATPILPESTGRRR